MQPLDIVLIRHGLTRENAEKRYLGRTHNPPLSPEGIRGLEDKQAAAPYPRAQALFVSPLLRCVQTAELLYPMLVPVQLPSLMELDFGAFEGKTYEQLKDNPAYRRFIDSAGRSAPPGGEGAEDFAARLSGAMEDIARRCASSGAGRAAVVTHGGCIMTLLSRFSAAGATDSSAAFYGYQAPPGGGYRAVYHPDRRVFDAVVPL